MRVPCIGTILAHPVCDDDIQHISGDPDPTQHTLHIQSVDVVSLNIAVESGYGVPHADTSLPASLDEHWIVGLGAGESSACILRSRTRAMRRCLLMLGGGTMRERAISLDFSASGRGTAFARWYEFSIEMRELEGKIENIENIEGTSNPLHSLYLVDFIGVKGF
jgi:hypothetical protein